MTKFETNCTPVRLVTFSVGAKTIIILHTKHFNPTVILYYIRTLHLLHGIPRSVLRTLNDIQQWIKKKMKKCYIGIGIYFHTIYGHICVHLCVCETILSIVLLHAYSSLAFSVKLFCVSYMLVDVLVSNKNVCVCISWQEYPYVKDDEKMSIVLVCYE